MEAKAKKRENLQDVEPVLIPINKDCQTTEYIHITKNEVILHIYFDHNLN